MNRKETVTRVEEIITPLLRREGLELWEVEFRGQGPRGILRVYLDKPGGVTLDDLTHVSQQLSDLLDAYDAVDSSYLLEVSSPGISRHLSRREHFQRFVGKRISVHRVTPVDGRKVIRGVLQSVETEGIDVQEAGGTVSIPFADIAKANYDHDFS